MSQGRNPWSDIGSREALALVGQHLVRAVKDPSDHAARDALSWAATLAGIAFGNAGVHVPHAMAYAVAGLVRAFRMPGYPEKEPLVPHGVSVVVSAPSAFRFTASACPERHMEAAKALGLATSGASLGDAGDVLARGLLALMKETNVPPHLGALGYTPGDVPALTAGTIIQKRLLRNAPRDVSEDDLRGIFAGAMQ